MQDLLSKYKAKKATKTADSSVLKARPRTDVEVDMHPKKPKPEKAFQQNDIQLKAAGSTISSVPLRQKIISVIFEGNDGFGANSITHYYHFFFGAMIPLLEYHLENKCAGYSIATDVGPMKTLLCELPLNIVGIVGPDASLRRSDAGLYADHVALPAYDIFIESKFHDQYVPHLRQRTIRDIIKLFEETMPPYIRQVPTFDILLIERTHRETYYTAIETDERNVASGASLRSILNHRQLEQALSAKYGPRFGNIFLERTGVYYQYHMFRNAKVVIAQHGAALSNIAFMRPESTVIEFNPPSDFIKLEHFKATSRTHFKNLAKHMGVPHMTLFQENDRAAVNVEDVLAAIDGVIGK